MRTLFILFGALAPALVTFAILSPPLSGLLVGRFLVGLALCAPGAAIVWAGRLATRGDGRYVTEGGAAGLAGTVEQTVEVAR